MNKEHISECFEAYKVSTNVKIAGKQTVDPNLITRTRLYEDLIKLTKLRDDHLRIAEELQADRLAGHERKGGYLPQTSIDKIAKAYGFDNANQMNQAAK